MTEIELKYQLLSDSEARRLEVLLGEPVERLFLATRYWLPTSPPGAAVRLREVGGATEASVKRSGGVPVDGLFIHDEQAERLDAGRAVGFISGEIPIDELSLVARGGLKGPFRYVGLILTRRHVYHVDGLSIEVDKVTFPDGTEDFELEVESPDAAAFRSKLLDLADQAGVALRPSEKTKLGRLLDRASPEERG